MKRLNIVCGAYGSGKTEFAIGYALEIRKKSPQKVGLIDLDIVNPYFRSRDMAVELGEKGLDVVSSEPGMEYSDIPSLSPRIYSLLQDHSYQVVFDVGGDPAGARALGRFYPYFEKEAYDLLVVVNPFRPDTRSVYEAADLITALQGTSRLQASGIVSNINLGPDTTLEVWQEGFQFIRELAERLALPIVYHMVEEKFFKAHQADFANYPIFPVVLRMRVPWLKEDN
ncbi:MAG TPA: hypothetical protein DDW50_02350 [Firmicutes bacterium]|jgi:hypothetical protein|nr:hypothetical protein [Bacillota bacterium]